SYRITVSIFRQLFAILLFLSYALLFRYRFVAPLLAITPENVISQKSSLHKKGNPSERIAINRS
ncbi:MAG: hypothetical protein ABID83_06015, partial [Candidatus Omnitrophota bacterium]